MVICLERGADLHMTQLVPLALTVSCFNGFTFLVLAQPGSPKQRAIKRVCYNRIRSRQQAVGECLHVDARMHAQTNRQPKHIMLPAPSIGLAET